MGNCCGSPAIVPSVPSSPSPAPAPPIQLPERMTQVQVLSSQPETAVPPSRLPSRTRSQTGSRPEPTRPSGMSSHGSNTRSRTTSAPQPAQSLKTSVPRNPRSRAETLTPSKRDRHRPPMLEHSKSRACAATTGYPGRSSLISAMEQVLVEHPGFRILVVGKRGSGKSSLINAAFGVNISAAPASAFDINFGHRPDNNRHFIVHEFSGLEPGDAQGLRTILDFISNRTDPSCAVPERLHAIWICVPASDALSRNIGEGIKDILNLGRVPVVVAFTKSDKAFPEITGSESGSSQHQDRTRSRVYVHCEQLCRPLFRKGPGDVPAELVSVMPQFAALINNLALVTMNQLNMCSGTVLTRHSSPGKKSRITDVDLRASRIMEASIEKGKRNRYWCNLWSNLYFADQPLEKCVDIIHNDIVEIWNLDDRNRYLISGSFKIRMSHVVKDLAVQAGEASPSPKESGDRFATWVHIRYKADDEVTSQKSVRCVMGYIVNLTVILDRIFIAAASQSNAIENIAEEVVNDHVETGRRSSIHQNIRTFVAKTFPTRFNTPQDTSKKDLVLEMIIDLIRQYRAHP